jgi:hypothetical protein
MHASPHIHMMPCQEKVGQLLTVISSPNTLHVAAGRCMPGARSWLVRSLRQPDMDDDETDATHDR